MPLIPHRPLVSMIRKQSSDKVSFPSYAITIPNHNFVRLDCRLPAHGVTSSACSLRATARIWLHRPCCAAAAAQQETQPLSKRQQKKQQQQQQQAADKGGPAVAPRSSDFNRYACT